MSYTTQDWEASDPDDQLVPGRVLEYLPAGSHDLEPGTVPPQIGVALDRGGEHGPVGDLEGYVALLFGVGPTLAERSLETVERREIDVDVTLATVAIGLFVAVLAGYALARFDLPLRRYLLLVVLATQMFPAVVLIIPLFTVMRRLDLLGTYYGLVIAYLSFSTPLAVWVLRGFFRAIPVEIEEAALVDGCTRFGAIRRIVLPLAGPGIAACSIFVFIAAWNEFLFALTFIKDDGMYTLPVGLTAFSGRAATDHGAIMAFSVMFTLPVVAFFLALHRRLTEGLVAGAVKG